MKKRIIFYALVIILFLIFPEVMFCLLFAWLLSKFAKEIYSDFAAVRARVKLKKSDGG